MKVGWEVKALGDFAYVKSGGTPSKSKKQYWSGSIPWYSSGELNDKFTQGPNQMITQEGLDNSNAKIFEKGSLLIGMYDTAAMKMSVLDRDASFNQAIAGVSPNPNFSIDFLHLALEWMKPDLMDLRRGTRQKNLSLSKIKEIPIPFPLLDEQKRIVAALDAAFEGLTRARAHIETNLQNARELFAQGVEALFADVDRGRIQTLRLGSIVTRLTNGYVGPTRDIYFDDGIPYLLARHVKNNRLRFDGRTYISPEFNKKLKKSMLKSGDVVLVQSGHIGHCAVIPPEHEGHNCHAMIVLSAMPEILSGHFLSAVLNTPTQQDHFQKIRTGSTVQHLTCKLVKEMMLPVPDLELQGEVVTAINALRNKVDGIEDQYRVKLQDLNDLRQSLLKKAFAGDLT